MKAALKKFSDYAPAILAALFLAVLLVSVCIDIYKIKHMNYSRLYTSLKTHLDKKQGFVFPPTEGDRNKASRKNIYVFGESSLVMSDGSTFPDYLNEMLNSGKQGTLVTNWGIPGIDSFSVKRRAFQALRTKGRKPDLIVIYTGHNDYNNIYQGYMPLYKGLPGTRLLLYINYHLQGAKYKDKYCPGDKKCNYTNYSRAVSPIVINALQASRLTTLNGSEYTRFNDLMLEHFMKNIRGIIAEAGNLGIPVVICTVIGNLHAEPFGDYRTVSKDYRLGIAARKYEDRIRLLRQARDGEVFSFDVRAKSELNAGIRSLCGDGVFVLDIENLLIKKRSEFGYDVFIDYFHMKTGTHKTIASMLADFIEQNNLLQKYSGKRAARSSDKKFAAPENRYNINPAADSLPAAGE
ncbi:MAG: hypothetical protein WCX65_07090 [bacterium]